MASKDDKKGKKPEAGKPQGQPWRSIWPIKDIVPPADQRQAEQAKDEPRTWYKSERGKLEEGQRQKIYDAMKDKFDGKQWYVQDRSGDQRCPTCGGTSGCGCSTFEGG